MREPRQLARQSDGAGMMVVVTRWNLVVQDLRRPLVIEHVAKVIEAGLCCARRDAAGGLSCPPSACDACVHGDRFVVVGLLECVHARSRASSTRVTASTAPVALSPQTVCRCRFERRAAPYSRTAASQIARTWLRSIRETIWPRIK